MLNDQPHALLNTPTATAPLPPWDKCLFRLQRRGTKYHTIIRDMTRRRIKHGLQTIQQMTWETSQSRTAVIKSRHDQ